MNSQTSQTLRKPMAIGEAAAAIFGGFRMMWLPGLRGLVILPLILNTVILALLLSTLGGWIQGWVEVLVSWLPDWLNWLASLFKIIIWLGMAMVFGLVFTVTANLVGAPFYGFLAARTEEKLTGKKPEAGLSVAQEAMLAVATEVRKTWYWLWRAALLGILSLILMWIPGINLFVPALWFIFGAWMLSLEYLDYPASNHGLDFRAKRAWLRQRRVLSYGFGSGVTAVTMIPILNLFAPPAAVVGATRLWVASRQDSLSQ